ncbi:MAG: nucleotide pyrophosphohydrolase [Candidatus Thorarchaeota archaeon]
MTSNNMNDNAATLSFFKEEIAKFVEERNWKKYHTPKNLIQALGIEVAELSEIFLFRNYEISEIYENKKLLESISDEIADVFIYLISLINCLKIDLYDTFTKKMLKNEKKYSVHEFNDGTFYKK